MDANRSRLHAVEQLFLEVRDIFNHLLNEMSDKQREILYKKSPNSPINDGNIDDTVCVLDVIIAKTLVGDVKSVKRLIGASGLTLLCIGEFFTEASCADCDYEIQRKMKQWGPILIEVAQEYSSVAA